MNGKGSSPRDQTPGPDGKTPARRYADNWEAVFGKSVAQQVADGDACKRCGLPVSDCAQHDDRGCNVLEPQMGETPAASEGNGGLR